MNKFNLSSPTSFSSLDSWLFYLSSLNIKKVNLTLTNIYNVAISLGVLDLTSRIILVGGTNGKGTTCRMLELILLKNKIKVGVYSSPHLIFYTERVRVLGCELSDNIHSESMADVNYFCKKNSIILSYFEFITLVALHIFKQFCLDVVIIEVGLGGRLDATNIVDPDISIITSIALDHMHFLGFNRFNIAKEKIGILRYGKPAIIGEPNYPDNLNNIAYHTGSILFARNRDWSFFIYGNYWNWWDCEGNSFLKLSIPSIPIDNAATAIASLKFIPFVISEESIRYAVKYVSLPGRFQIISKFPLVILDVAHNPHSAKYLAKRLCSIYNFSIGKVRAVVGMLIDKDILGTLSYFLNIVNVWYFSSLNSYRTASVEYLSSCVLNNNCIFCFDNIVNAWLSAIHDSSTNDCVVVFGSFYSVSPILSIIYNNRHIFDIL